MKINYRRDLFKGYSGLCESIFCAPFEDPEKFKEDEFENDRFNNLINQGKDYLHFTDIESCDYVIIPYKWDNYSQLTCDIIDEAKRLNKKVIALHNDDFAPSVKLKEEDGYLFTTTIASGLNQNNEFSFPAFTGDYYQNTHNTNRRFGFCGAITHNIRHQILSLIYNSDLNKDFIIRSGFWAPELTKLEARKQYMSHIEDNTFIICIRGAGNFSYRLYETMMMGRIPIIIDTQQVLPFETSLDYSDFSFRINYNDLELLNKLKDISLALSDGDIIKMQDKSREVWKEYMSPEGWIKNFKKELL